MVISVSAGIGPPRPGTFNIVHVANHFRAGCGLLRQLRLQVALNVFFLQLVPSQSLPLTRSSMEVRHEDLYPDIHSNVVRMGLISSLS